MMKVLTTLIRGAVAEAEEAVFDQNATRVLAQQLRDAATALELGRQTEARGLDERMASAGFGTTARAKPADVLARIRATAGGTAGEAAGPGPERGPAE